MYRMFFGFFLIGMVLSAKVFAEGVPKSLFGVTLGEVYKTESKNDFAEHGFPVEKITGAQSFMGHGMHFYFKPKKAYPGFPYAESEPRKSDSDFHKTSFRLYVFPIIPEDIDTAKLLESKETWEWEVALIEWSDDDAGNSWDTYERIKNLCDMFAQDLNMEPDIVDKISEVDKVYSCTFTTGQRQLKATSRHFPRVSLSYTQELSRQREKAMKRRINELRINEIRPYSK